ncbi:hypothetical protein ACQW02_19125 [Humitalea sp. 24SJ18S-53]|uniref:hypothetical protein n=1 Tax=Humitalea sp. 24SJ18S-53 TaxID=3422307 RepID=UPI003D672916
MKHIFAAALILAASSTASFTRDLFSVELTVDGATDQRSYSSLQQAADALTTDSLQSININYTDVSAATANINLRGVPAVATYTANSPFLRIQVPGAGVDKTFTGTTRDDSQDQFVRWLQGAGGSDVTRILQLAVATTPIDPVAGNPNSAMTQMSVSDFNRSLQSSFGERGGVGIGARFGSFSSAGYNSQNFTLPLDYSWRVTERDTLEVDVPFAYTDTQGATSYSGNLGFLYRRQIFDVWSLQASGRFGGAGSVDLGSATGLYGLGINSILRFDLPMDLRLTIANGINYVATLPVSLGRYTANYDIANTIFRNGVVLSRDLGMSIAGMPVMGSVFAIDTRFTGSEVFISNYQEFGAFVSAGRDSTFGLGFTVMTGDQGLSGFTINTGVKF